MPCDTPGKSGLCFRRVGRGIGGVGGGWGRRYRGEVSVGMRDPPDASWVEDGLWDPILRSL